MRPPTTGVMKAPCQGFVIITSHMAPAQATGTRRHAGDRRRSAAPTSSAQRRAMIHQSAGIVIEPVYRIATPICFAVASCAPSATQSPNAQSTPARTKA